LGNVYSNLISIFETGWMEITLILAGIYNILWGGFIVLYPDFLFQYANLHVPRYPEIWQCVGMIVGVYGIGYLAASLDPLVHWPIVLVGALGKLLGPIGFAFSLYSGRFNTDFGIVIISNDIIWWVPFGLILYKSWTSGRNAHQKYSP